MTVTTYTGRVVGVQDDKNGINTVSAGSGLSSLAFRGAHSMEVDDKVRLTLDVNHKVTGVEVLEPAGV